jgi:hypothetical protein
LLLLLLLLHTGIGVVVVIIVIIINSIRSDPIQIRFDFDWMQSSYQFYPISNQLRFDSIVHLR